MFDSTEFLDVIRVDDLYEANQQGVAVSYVNWRSAVFGATPSAGKIRAKIICPAKNNADERGTTLSTVGR